MILACPTCHTRYTVEDDAVTRPSGRNVRCASCGHAWLYLPAAPPVLRLRERTIAADEVAPTPRPAITAPAPPRRGRHSGMGWVIVILFIGAAVVAAIVGRDEIIARWPRAARLYDLVGLRSEPLGAGLEIANITSTRNADGLIVEGDIANKSGSPHDVPRLRVALRDTARHELIFKTVDPPRERLLPGEASHFVVGFLPAPDAASGVTVTFVAG